MKPFITGAAGFIGSELVKRFESPICFDRKDGDIRNLSTLFFAMNGTDVVFHLAAHTNSRAGIENPQLDYTNQVVGTMNVLESMIVWGIKKLVYTSTCGVYGDDTVKPISETHKPLVPICPYAQCKLISEWMIRDYVEKHDIQAWILRLGNVVGGRMQNGVIRDLILKLKRDKTKLDIMGSAIGSRPFLSVEDCVDGILYAFEHSNEQINIFSIGGSESTTIGRIVDILLEEVGLDIPVNYEKQDAGWPGSAVRVRLNVNKINKLGWKVKLNSDEAVRKAVREILKYENFS